MIDGVEVFAAFDEEILLLTGLLKDNVDRRLSSLREKHETEIKEIAETSWLDKLIWLFKPKGVLPNEKRSV